MSAYISRLQQRFSVEGARPGPSPVETLDPFVRSRSPIAHSDQRLGVDERLGHGLGGLEPSGLDDPAPAQTSSDRAPDSTLRREVDDMRTQVSPTPAPAPAFAASTGEASTGEASASAASPVRPARAIAGEPAAPSFERDEHGRLDPPSLFDPLAQALDESPAPAAVSGATNTAFVAGRVSALPPTRSSSPERASVGKSARADVDPPAPAVLQPTSAPSPELRRSLAPASTSPWRLIDHAAAATAPIAALSEAPILAPTILDPRPTPASEAPRLYIVPNLPEPTPFIPDPGPAPRPTPAPTQARAERPSARVETQPTRVEAPTPPRRSSAPPRTLTIDDVSQIGPLDRHFPNRRRSWRRYR